MKDYIFRSSLHTVKRVSLSGIMACLKSVYCTHIAVIVVISSTGETKIVIWREYAVVIDLYYLFIIFKREIERQKQRYKRVSWISKFRHKQNKVHQILDTSSAISPLLKCVSCELCVCALFRRICELYVWSLFWDWAFTFAIAHQPTVEKFKIKEKNKKKTKQRPI